MTNSTRRFVILSQNINTSFDVFDRLIKVKDKDSGEIGSLLCSSMCDWPEDLIPQATWLEGCKTPQEFQHEPRLALGYHPEQYTQWRVFKETNEIEIYLTGVWDHEGPEIEGADFHWIRTGLSKPSFKSDDWAGMKDRFKPSVIRLFQRILSVGITQESMNVLESTVHRLFHAGVIDDWEATVLPYWMTAVIFPYEEIHWEGHDMLFWSMS